MNLFIFSSWKKAEITLIEDYIWFLRILYGCTSYSWCLHHSLFKAWYTVEHKKCHEIIHRTRKHSPEEYNIRTLKKFTKEGSSGTSVTLEAVDDDGSRGPSITAKVGTASSSSNSLRWNITEKLFLSFFFNCVFYNNYT